MRLTELAERIGCRLEGDGGPEVDAVRPPEDAGPRDVTFIAAERYLPRLQGSRAGAVILAEGLPRVDCPTLRASNPFLAFARALTLLHPTEPSLPGIHPTALVAPDARVALEVCVGPYTVLGPGAAVGAGTVLDAHVTIGAGVQVGQGCRIYPQVVLREGVVLGNGVIIHSGAVIGADGFGYVRDGRRYVKIPQIGRVVIEDDVEIGANTTIDRATLGETRIGRGSKIDNLVQIAHNVQVGADTVIVAQVGISGSSRVGSRVTLAGQAGVVDHVEIGDDVIVGAQAGVTKDIPSGTVVLGSPAIRHMEFKRHLAETARLPEMRTRMRALEKRLAELEGRLGE
jgi:UDP-3-O-[3-hydroxymyristoyl] glucosamine N-acyltransferase